MLPDPPLYVHATAWKNNFKSVEARKHSRRKLKKRRKRKKKRQRQLRPKLLKLKRRKRMSNPDSTTRKQKRKIRMILSWMFIDILKVFA